MLGQGEVEGGINIEGKGLYGGSDDDDNSGILKYVRIEYAGYAFEPGKEINALTLCAVGRKTTIDYIQTYYSNDDAFEWFGGTVNCKHLISFNTLDDDFDTDNGYSGNVQFLLCIRDADIADISKSNGIESDNDASGTATTPKTSAVFSNITLVGPIINKTDIINSNYNSGVHVRRNSQISVFNSIVIGYPIGVIIDGSTTKNNAISGSIEFQNNYVGGNLIAIKGASAGGFTDSEALNWLSNTSNNNKIDNTVNDNVYSIFKNYYPKEAINFASFNDQKTNKEFFTKVDYIGASKNFEDKWWEGWTNFKTL